MERLVSKESYQTKIYGYVGDTQIKALRVLEFAWQTFIGQ